MIETFDDRLRPAPADIQLQEMADEASAAFIILSEGLGFNVDSELYWKLVALALGYIFGEAAVDIARAKAGE